MEDLAATLKVSVGELKYAVVLFSVFPLGFLHRQLTNVQLRLIYSLICGATTAYFMFGLESLHFWGSATMVYLLMKYLPHRSSPWIVFTVLMIHLSYGHIQRMFQNYLEFSLDWSLPQMLLVCKLSFLSWSYHDGQIPIEKVKRPERREKRIERLPSLLEYYSYVFFFAGFLTGPFPEYKDFSDFMNRSMFKENEGKIPSAWKSIVGKLIVVVLAYIGVLFTSSFPEVYTTTEEFLQRPFIERILYIIICVELGSCKYYFAFLMGEAGCTAAGVSYNGRDSNGNAKWDRILMIRIWEFKTATHQRAIVQHWNIPCQIWLKECVHTRLLPALNNRVAALLITYLTSAFWHGFYPGYYFFFLSGAFFSLIGDKLGDLLRPICWEGKKGLLPQLYHIGSWALTFWAITYIILVFRLMDFWLALKGWASIYFINHVGAVILLVIFMALPKQKKKTSTANHSNNNNNHHNNNNKQSLIDKVD